MILKSFLTFQLYSKNFFEYKRTSGIRTSFNPLSAKKSQNRPKWKWLYPSAPSLPVSPSLFTSQFQSLVVYSLRTETCFHVVYIQHAALNGLKGSHTIVSYLIHKKWFFISQGGRRKGKGVTRFVLFLLILA